jgi:hypothetical protein
MAEATPPQNLIQGPVDCACVIHGNAYSWTYVERLYNMLNRHITQGIRFHVYTEAHRPVPEHMIKHELTDFGPVAPRRAWWYKMQLFDTQHHRGPLLYFDLDTVIVNNIDWIPDLPLKYFWTVRDFKQLWKSTHHGINSSIMWWNTETFADIWTNFRQQNFNEVMRRYPGDQDYLTVHITESDRRFFDQDRIKSWRWQCKDGGYDFRARRHHTPGTGTCYQPTTSVLVFHGKPKPDQITDPVVQQHWK